MQGFSDERRDDLIRRGILQTVLGYVDVVLGEDLEGEDATDDDFAALRNCLLRCGEFNGSCDKTIMGLRELLQSMVDTIPPTSAEEQQVLALLDPFPNEDDEDEELTS